MNIVKLKSFLVLAEYKSFSKAADILYCSQPAISKQIESLENELQVPLFNRIRNKISLTIQGEHFKYYAEEIVKLYENSKEHIRQIENLNEGTLFFGATNFIGVYIVPKLIKEFQTLYPKIEINMVIQSSRKLFSMLEKHEIEFIFLSHYVDIDKNKYITRHFCTDELVLILNNNHRLSNQSSCKLTDVKDELFITKDSSSSLYKFLGEKIQDFDFKRKLIISNQEAIKHAVIEGIGISIMSKISVETEVKAGLIKALTIEDYSLVRDINLVYDRRKHITPAGHAFFELMKLDSINNI
jgi:DNA-binding transcriptional LysR family regulator